MPGCAGTSLATAFSLNLPVRTSAIVTRHSSIASGRRIALLALFLSILFGVAGQLLMKWAALRTVAPKGDSSVWSLMQPLAFALAVYSLGIANWIVALRRLSLSTAYPLTSLNYIGILIGSYYWFGERITLGRGLGVTLIFLGVLLVVRGARGTRLEGSSGRTAAAGPRVSP
jgi:multidrug transporter EmrE-like cation transporter